MQHSVEQIGACFVDDGGPLVYRLRLFAVCVWKPAKEQLGNGRLILVRICWLDLPFPLRIEATSSGGRPPAYIYQPSIGDKSGHPRLPLPCVIPRCCCLNLSCHNLSQLTLLPFFFVVPEKSRSGDDSIRKRGRTHFNKKREDRLASKRKRKLIIYILLARIGYALYTTWCLASLA